jgi:hypothetical protein
VYPLNPDPTPEADAMGRKGESELRLELARAKKNGEIEGVCFPDAVVLSVQHYPYGVELKTQDRFTAPPFDGHGLAVSQANYYMTLYPYVWTLLVVREPDGTEFRQWLHVLERGRKFDTVGKQKTPRRVYPLENFTRMDPR